MEQPIFIVGCERSGTTLLRLILNQSPVLHIPRETLFLPTLTKQQEIYGDFTKPYQRWFLSAIYKPTKPRLNHLVSLFLS